MPETWINCWTLAKNGKITKTEKMPQEGTVYVYETAERPAPEISHHTFFCPHTGETRTFDATSDKDRAVKRRKIVREMLDKIRYRSSEY